MSLPVHTNLFRWYADYKAGYWSPFLNQFPKTLIDNVVKQTSRKVVITDKRLWNVDLSKLYEPFSAAAGDTPAQHWTANYNRMVVEDVAVAGLLAAAQVEALVSLGLDQDVIDELFRIPVVEAATRHAVDAHIAEYEFGARPNIERYFNSKYTPHIPEAYRIGLAASKGLLSDADFYKYMAEDGFSKEWADMWREENYFYPELGLALELVWRGVITRGVAVDWMVKAGYKKAVAEQAMAVVEQIPPSSDLITMVVREAFIPEMVIKSPELFTKYIAMRGFSSEWADRYWTAHFLPIGLTQAYSNLWRGFWTKEQFFRALTIADIHPMWHEDIYNVAFGPPSLRELGYGWDVGVYTEANIERYRRMEGLSPEDAKLAAKSMVAYRTEAEREAVRREHMYLFSLGKESEADFRANLKRLTTAAEAAELWVERGKLQAARQVQPEAGVDYLIVTSSEAITAFKYGLRDEPWLRSKLKDLNWTDERIELSVVRAKKELEPAPVVEAPVEYKQLTLAQVESLYKVGVLKAEDLPGAIVGLGYTQTDAERLTTVITYISPTEAAEKALTRADIQAAYGYGFLTYEQLYERVLGLGYSEDDATVISLMIVLDVRLPDLKKLYSNGWISQSELYNELLALKLSEEQADMVMMLTVKAEAPARTSAEKSLTKTEILKGVKQNVLTPEQGVELLIDLGYSSEEARYILAINNIVTAGDPESYWDMKNVTEAYKASLGKESKVVPYELKELEKKVKEARDKLKALQTSGASDEAVAQSALELQNLELAYRKALALWEQSS